MRTIKTNYYRGTQQKHIFTASHNISLISLLNLIINIFRKERERAATFSLMMALQRITLAPLLLHKMHFSLLEKLFLWFFLLLLCAFHRHSSFLLLLLLLYIVHAVSESWLLWFSYMHLFSRSLCCFFACIQQYSKEFI